MNVLFCVNLDKKNAKECTRKVISALSSCHAVCCMDVSLKQEFRDIPPLLFGDFFELIASCDLLLSIGGDGTILHAAQHAVAYHKPLLGINAGRLGFMAGLECADADDLNRLVSGNYTVNRRMLLSVLHKSGETCRQYTALNDAVIAKSSLSNVIDIEVSSAQKAVGFYRADGLIFATPTGSTAYALSAGGPVIDPKLEAIVLQPVCPHALSSRALLFEASTVLQVKLGSQTRNEAYLAVDGQTMGRLRWGDEITITKSGQTLALIGLNEKEFYELVHDKFLK